MTLARVWAWAVVIVATLATASPLVPSLRGRKGDSFPLTWFPMFAGERPKLETPTYIVGFEPDGTRVKIDVSVWTTGGFNQGRNMLTTAIKQKRGRQFCEMVAQRIVRRRSSRFADVERLQIVKGTYDREAFFLGDTAPIHESVLARCPVKR
jgi:hypothetical protein